MRNEKTLIKLLRGVVDLLASEAERNPDFAARLDQVLQDLPARSARAEKRGSRQAGQLPDIHTEWNTRGEVDFRLWLRDQPISILRALVRAHGFDPARRTSKWREAEKLSEFIADNLRSRLSRGAVFLSRGRTE
jgi:hypothetical protein